MHLTGQYWVCALQIAFSDNNKTPPMCKTRGRSGWVLMRQPSRPNASRSVIQQPHTHIYEERENMLPFFISVHFCFLACTFTQHHHHRDHQEPWPPWATFVIEALPTWRLAHSCTVLLLLRCRYHCRIGDVVVAFWRASFLH